MNNNLDEDIDEFEALIAKLGKNHDDVSTEKKYYYNPDIELINSLEYEEKLKIVSEMEKKYAEKFGDIISDDEEYCLMSFGAKIQTIQKCLDTNTPKLIIPGGNTLIDDDKNQCSFLKRIKIFY